jgi:phage terminase large subunit-like protein
LNPQEELTRLILLMERRRKYFKLDYYKPYPFQLAFHNAVGHKSDTPAIQRVLMAANQIGKTYSGAMHAAIHLTGKYPDWWKGERFRHPILMLCGGNTNEAARDILQKELFGDPNEPALLGSGAVPVDCIGKRTSKPGVPNAFDVVNVKHVSGGWSKAMFRAYEQGPKKHMGIKIDLGWCDEEPPEDIWSQYMRATFSTRGYLYITFTPENGMTEVVRGFLDDLKPGQALINAGWNDAPHMIKPDGSLTDRAKQALDAIPVHEREMRTRGVPKMGSGLVYPFSEEQLTCDPIEIPRHWPRIIGLDFGINDDFAAVQFAWDRDSDVVYMISEFKQKNTTAPTHASHILKWNGGNAKWIPVAWPHDGLNREKSTGRELRQFYADEGLLMLPQKASNPADYAQGQAEGDGGNSKEASILAMYERMERGGFKVFKSCTEWLKEVRMYHRKDGKIVDAHDHLMDASRTAHMMLRHARTETIKRSKRRVAAGATNWG